MGNTIISWNITNLVTVILMALLFFMVLGLATKYIQKKGISK